MTTIRAAMPTVRADISTDLGGMPSAFQDFWSSGSPGSSDRSGHFGVRERLLGLSAYDRYVSGRGCGLGPFRLGVFSPLFHAHAHPPTGLFRVRKRP
ncbi:hypothetical protein OG194_28430 [Streptomyces sp. NBC_01288]|uniref:hypothetical protein n=1 Tax=Streptomyces sp. NBC_01288 TaxID=2903814 RepID=UPI002E145E4E|nr:hypothetical protein OG194_28430 [Streptomyces sp. NBC_01288]